MTPYEDGCLSGFQNSITAFTSISMALGITGLLGLILGLRLHGPAFFHI